MRATGTSTAGESRDHDHHAAGSVLLPHLLADQLAQGGRSRAVYG